MKKVKLISALKTVIYNLEIGSVNYDWTKTSQCNCGLVSQAILGAGSGELNVLLSPVINHFNEQNPEKYKKGNPNWQEMVTERCPLTGEPMDVIFKMLYAAGMTREDIFHLENLSDPKILKHTNIVTKGWVQTTTKTVTKRVNRGGLLGILGLKKTIHKQEKTQKDIYYYAVQENLIKYLRAWVSILEEEGITPTATDLDSSLDISEEKVKSATNPSSKPTISFEALTDQGLEDRLNKALAREDYETAALIREEKNHRALAKTNK